MDHIIRALTFLLISVFVNSILGYLRQPKKAKDGMVFLPKLLAIFGIVTSGIFLIPAIITAFLGEQLWVPILFLFLSSLGAILIIAFINCRITYDEEGFVAKNFFGKKRKFTYDQVTAIKENMHENYIYMGKHRVMVDEFSIGGADFMKHVKKKYRIANEGLSLPKIYKTKHDIFNGNVNDVGGFLFAYILVGVIVIGLLGFSIYFAYFTPSTADNTIEQSVCFVSCDADEDEVVLTSADKQIYIIRFTDEQFDTTNIQAICDGKTAVITYSTEVTPDDGAPYYSVKAILFNGAYLLSFDETNQLHRQEYTMLVVFALGMGLVWGAVVVCSIIVGRNPQKFSKRFVRLFFKDGYIKY